MRAKKTINEYRDPKAIQNIISVNKKMKADFHVLQSNYTTEIFYPDANIRHKFFIKEMPKRAFIGFAKMKKDVLFKYPENSDFWKKDIEKNISLFDTVERPETVKSVINFDLKNAYPTALFKSGLISEESAKFIEKCKKLERLQSIGIFASKKTVFEYIQGYLCDIDIIESPLRNVYFYASKVTDNIMKAAREVVKDDFLFYWFDGIYFERTPRSEKRLTDFFRYNSIDFKKEVLTNFKAEQTSASNRYSYQDAKGNFKTFAIPKKDHERHTNAEILKAIQ